MLSYCLNCGKIQRVKSRMARTSKGKLILLSKCTVYDNKKSRFMRNQEAGGLMNNFGIRTP